MPFSLSFTSFHSPWRLGPRRGLSFLFKLFHHITDCIRMATEEIILSLDISSKKLGEDGVADELSKEISQELDKALREAETGKWVGGSSALETMQIIIRTDEADTAIPIIKSTLAGYQFFPPDRIEKQIW